MIEKNMPLFVVLAMFIIFALYINNREQKKIQAKLQRKAMKDDAKNKRISGVIGSILGKF